MKNKYFFHKLKVAFFLILLISLTSCSNFQSQDLSNLSQTDLDKEKTLLEIDLAQRELWLYPVEKVTALAGAALGSIAILWTIFQGYKTLKHQSNTQKASRIAQLLSEISDKEEGIRIGAARGLSRYADEVINEIISALSLEKSPQIRLALEDTLSPVNNSGFQKIISINSETIPTRAYLLGRLSSIGATPEYADALLRLSPFSRQLIKKDFGFQFDQGKNFQENENNRDVALNKPKASENLALVQIADQISRTVEGTANILARKLRNDEERLSRKGRQIDLALTNLYKVNLSEKELSGSIFFGCLMRHAIFDQSDLSESDMGNCNLYDASMYKANFTKANLENAHMRAVKGEEAIFFGANLSEAVFSNGLFSHSDFREVKAIKSKFRNAILSESQFKNATLNESEFQEANLKDTNFDSAECYGANFINADFSNANLMNVKFGGADLRGAKFQNANLSNADLSGANISKADFRGAIIDNIILKKVKNKESALFDNMKKNP